MAVYTKIPPAILEAFIATYPLGGLVKAEEILQGIDNSNFFITTQTGKYVLTLFEQRVNPADLPFFIGLMQQVARNGIACPLPLSNRHGQTLQMLMDRPAILSSFLEGAMVTAITPPHCGQVGGLMARLHKAVADFPLSRANSLSVAGWQALWQRCAGRADGVAAGLADFITGELAYLAAAWPKLGGDLPAGIIHADLFDDNIFFKDGQLCGVIDFYFACHDFFAYDIAITLNAWCFDRNHQFQPARAADMLQGYQALRPLHASEWAALPLLLRGASLRFLLTRLHDWLFQPPDALVHAKDPLEYYQKLLFFRDNTSHIAGLRR